MKNLLEQQRKFFYAGTTLSVDYRIQKLKELLKEVKAFRSEIEKALYLDLNKSPAESYTTEIYLVEKELHHFIKKLRKWSAPRRKLGSLLQMPSTMKNYYDPYGNTLILAPWNYPFQLTFMPLVGAVGGGNTAIVRPSTKTPHTAEIMKKIIEKVFPQEYVAMVLGDQSLGDELLKLSFDKIFFTGSSKVGKKVMKMASEHLTPVTLELGGKSPCIVEESAYLPTAARRITFGKLLNAGQTCIAPDYLYVQKSVKDRFIQELIKELKRSIPDDSYRIHTFPKIVSKESLQRLESYLQDAPALYEGGIYYDDRQMLPYVLDEPSWDSPVMNEEIFGPVIPIVTFESVHEVVEKLQSLEKPLALYLFTKNKEVEELITSKISYGGGCINDTVFHVVSSKNGFGGVGNSGMGRYHGYDSFLAFTHKKSVVKKYTNFEPLIKNLPFTKTKEKLFKRIP